MKVKEEKKEEKSKRSALHHDKHDHRHMKKSKSGSRDKDKSSELNGKHHRSTKKHSSSGSLQECTITSSEKAKSDSGNSGAEADGMDVDVMDGFEKSVESLDGNNNLAEMTLLHEKSYNKGDYKEVMGEVHKPKKKSHKMKEKNKEKEASKRQGSRSRNNGNNKSSKGSFRDKKDKTLNVKVTGSENSPTTPRAIKEEEDEDDEEKLQNTDLISGSREFCLPEQNNTEVKKEKRGPKKTAEKERTKEKKQGQEKKRKSQSSEHDEAKKNKKVKRDEDEDKKDQKVKKEAKKAEEEANKWKW